MRDKEGGGASSQGQRGRWRDTSEGWRERLRGREGGRKRDTSERRRETEKEREGERYE